MSWHVQGAPSGFGLITLPDPAAKKLSKSERDFIEQSFKGDWSALKDGVTDAATGEAKQFLKNVKIEFPAGGMTELVDAVQTISRFFDGNISKEDAVALGKTIGEASAVIIGAAIGSVVPGLGTAIGTGVGLIVGALWNAFEDHTKELKEASKHAQQSIREIRKNVEKWEDSVRVHAWIITANLAGDHRLISDYETMGLKGLTSKQRARLNRHLNRAMKFMKRFGFAPKRATSIAEPVYKGQRLQYEKDSRAYCKAHGGKKGGWTCGLNRRIDWNGIAEYTEEFARQTNHGYLDEGAVELNLTLVKNRMTADARAMAVYEAYVAQLRTTANLLAEQAKKKGEALKALTEAMAALSKMYPTPKEKKKPRPPVSLPQIVSHENVLRAKAKQKKEAEAAAAAKAKRHAAKIAAAKHRAAVAVARAASAKKLALATRRAADVKAAKHAEREAASAMREATKVETGAEIPWGMVALGVGVVGVGAYFWHRSRAA